MPPKSAKKEQIGLWLACDKCGVKVIQSKLKNHECGSSTWTGIHAGTFATLSVTTSLPPELESLKNAPTSYLQRFIFVPETLSALCGFKMGCNLIINVNGKKHVKSCWVISDKYMDEVFTNSEELKTLVGNESPLTITKFHETSRVASQIELESSEELQDTRHVERLLKVKLKDAVIHKDNIIAVSFLNKKLTFVISSMNQVTTEDVSEMMAQVNLSDDFFYLINSETLISVKSFKNQEANDENRIEFSLDRVGGLDEIIKELKRVIDLAIGEVQENSRMKISRAVLIHGISGSGKTMLCHALAASYPNARKVFIDSWRIFSKFYGESEANLKKHFDEAFSAYPTPTIVIIDEFSNICPKNDSSDAIRRVSTLLSSIFDSLHVKRNASRVFVLVNTNNLDNIDPAMRRSGRLDFEIEIPVPTSEVRGKILEKLLVESKINSSEIQEVARHTHGFVAADLENLIAKSTETIERGGIFTTELTLASLLEHLSSVKPSAMRELLIEKPNVKWSDIGGMEDLKLKLKQIVEWPLNHPETFIRLGIKPTRGLLMFGPPGCSKTMIAKALASESNLNFISIKGSDLFSMWVGESEKAVRDLFAKARQLSPCIVFFDEIDAIGGERSSESGSSVKERVLAQILTEIDGVNVLKNVIIIAATNRPDLIDRALMRPGRLDRIVYVKLPDPETRREIFKIKLLTIPISEDVKIDELVDSTEGYSGAEIEAVCKEAALKALEDSFDIQEISMKYFKEALKIVTPRTSQELLKLYEDYEKRK